MAKCKYETSNGRCGMKDCYAYRHKCYTEEFCKCHKPQTNADRIRAMNDEELATMFYRMCVGMEFCDECPAVNNCPGESVGHWEGWLKQPSE